MARMFLFAAVGCTWVATLSSGAPRERVTLSRPVPVSFEKKDGSSISGRVTAFDQESFELLDEERHTTRFRWADLDARPVFTVRSTLIAPGDARAWLELGRDLTAREGAKEWSHEAFDRAVALDPKLRDEIPPDQYSASAPPGAEDAVGDAASSMAGQAAPPPPIVSAASEKQWLRLSEVEQVQAVQSLKASSAAEIARIHRPLQLHETRFFLFFSDLPAAESDYWTGLLDQMYARLAELFGVEKGRNIWSGKIVLYVFSDKADYRRFEREIRRTEPGDSAGMTHCFDDGSVKIAFYRQPRELVFAHVLVHESVHGFVHRYRTSGQVPSWANEGLAEAIASEVVPDPARARRIMTLAQRGLAEHPNNLNSFFSARHIELWQYPVAETFCQYMIRGNKPAYVAFIDGIKDGKPWQASLEASYKQPLAKLVESYINALNSKVPGR